MKETDALDDYILQHIDEEGEYLKALYRATHVKLLRPRMASGHLQGRMLKMFVQMIRPKQVLEIGTYSGYSALCLAEGLEEGAMLHTFEINDEQDERILKIIPVLKEKGYNTFDYDKEIGNRKEYSQPVEHLALGKKVTFNIPYWPNYPANGEKTLTDGLRGGWNYNDKRWLGFANNHRMDVVIDLEKVTKIHSVSADFMQIWGPYVYMPSKVVISSSVDGKDYTQLTAIDHQVQKDDSVSFKKFSWEGETDARYIRYQAMADSLYKDGIQFVDEIIVK